MVKKKTDQIHLRINEESRAKVNDIQYFLEAYNKGQSEKGVKEKQITLSSLFRDYLNEFHEKINRGEGNQIIETQRSNTLLSDRYITILRNTATNLNQATKNLNYFRLLHEQDVPFGKREFNDIANNLNILKNKSVDMLNNFEDHDH